MASCLPNCHKGIQSQSLLKHGADFFIEAVQDLITGLFIFYLKTELWFLQIGSLT